MRYAWLAAALVLLAVAAWLRRQGGSLHSALLHVPPSTSCLLTAPALPLPHCCRAHFLAPLRPAEEG